MHAFLIALRLASLSEGLIYEQSKHLGLTDEAKASTHFSDVVFDDVLLVTDTLHEEEIESLLLDKLLIQGPSTLPSRVGCVENGHFACGKQRLRSGSP